MFLNEPPCVASIIKKADKKFLTQYQTFNFFLIALLPSFFNFSNFFSHSLDFSAIDVSFDATMNSFQSTSIYKISIFWVKKGYKKVSIKNWIIDIMYSQLRHNSYKRILDQNWSNQICQLKILFFIRNSNNKSKKKNIVVCVATFHF
jgi:hypothetical protein